MCVGLTVNIVGVWGKVTMIIVIMAHISPGILS